MPHSKPISQKRADSKTANRTTFLNRSMQYLALSQFALLSPMLMAEASSANATTPLQTAEYSIGAGLNTLGLGISISGDTGWHFKDGDQVQWRAVLAGIDADDIDDFEIDDIDYDNGELKTIGLQCGLDWYPYQQGWAKQVFFSTGILYTDIELNGTADNNKTIYVGAQRVNPGDITSLTTTIEDTDIAPYISLGWGNKITGSRGFRFHAELGLTPSTSDADVKVIAVDPSNILSSADLAKEKREIEDDIDGVSAFAAVNLAYHF